MTPRKVHAASWAEGQLAERLLSGGEDIAELRAQIPRGRHRTPAYLRRLDGVAIQCEKCQQRVGVIMRQTAIGEWLLVLTGNRSYRLDLPAAGQAPPTTRCRCELEWTLDPQRVRAAGKSGSRSVRVARLEAPNQT